MSTGEILDRIDRMQDLVNDTKGLIGMVQYHLQDLGRVVDDDGDA